MTQTELLSYDKYLVQCSGGKDSTACFLHLLDQGVPRERIELWHQLVDGPGETWMDWEIIVNRNWINAPARKPGQWDTKIYLYE